MSKKDIKLVTVEFKRIYQFEINKNASDEFIEKQAQSMLNNDLCWEIDVIHQFDCKIIKEE